VSVIRSIKSELFRVNSCMCNVYILEQYIHISPLYILYENTNASNLGLNYKHIKLATLIH